MIFLTGIKLKMLEIANYIIDFVQFIENLMYIMF